MWSLRTEPDPLLMDGCELCREDDTCLARPWLLRSLVLSCVGYPVVIPNPISLNPSTDLGLEFLALLVVD